MDSKRRSRTFAMAVIWTAFVPLSLIAQVLVPEIEIPTGTIVGLAGGIVVAWLGKRAVQENAKKNGS